MALEVGIVGLPGSGKTTLFTALTKTGGGTTDFYNYSNGALHLVVDCYGYFSGN